MPAARLAFDGLLHGFEDFLVLDGVSARVGAGEVLEVVGSNGSGKSTLLRCLAALLKPEAGRIELEVDGRLLETRERRAAVGYAAPDLELYDELTTGENLRFFSRLRRVPEARGDEMLRRVELTAQRRAGALSSGMRQRLRWAWALLAQPAVLLLDEPFQNLDRAGEATLRGLLEEHLDAGGIAVIANPLALELPHVAGRLDLDR